jgi:hypothetical protein
MMIYGVTLQAVILIANITMRCHHERLIIEPYGCLQLNENGTQRFCNYVATKDSKSFSKPSLDVTSG